MEGLPAGQQFVAALPWLVEKMGVALVMVAQRDGKQAAVYVNEAFAALVGRSRASLILDPWSWIAEAPPEDRAVLAALWQRLQEGEPGAIELRLARPGGERRWLALEALPLPAGLEGGQCFAVVALDLTSAKQAEAARHELETRLKAVFSSPRLGLAMISPQGHILEANHFFRTMQGHGLDLEKEFAALTAETAARGEDFSQVERRYLRQDHQVVWVRLSVSLMRDESGQPQMGLGLVENISGYRRTEEALKMSRERFRLLYDKAPLGYQALDGEGLFLEVNQTWLDMTGFRREEVLGRWFGSFLTPSSAACFQEAFAALKSGREFAETELELVRRDGRRLVVAATAKAAVDQEGRFRQAHLMVADLTHRREAEAEQKRLQRLLTSTFNAFHDLILVLNRDFQVVMSNWRNLPPMASEGREGSYCYEIFAGHHSPCKTCHLKDVFARGQAREVERTSPDGRIWEIRAFPIKDDQGEVILAVQHVVDGTERRRAEAALRQSEQNYRLLVGNIPGVVFKRYGDGSLEVFDDEVEELTGYPRQAFAHGGLKWWDLLWAEDRVQAEQLVAQASATTRSYVLSYRIRHRDGRLVWVQDRGQIILNDRGETDHVIGVFFDITNQKAMEEQLAQEKERLAVTLRSIGDGVIATDTEGRIVLMNQVAERFTGWTQAEALGRPASQVFAIYQEQSGVRCEDPVAQVIRTGQTVGLANSTMLLSRDHRALSVAASSAPIVDRGQVLGVVLVFRDITARKQMEGELLKIEKLSSLSLLAGGIAHDFNNILTGILGNLSLARVSFRDGDQVLARLAEAEQAAIRARDLVQQLLTFAKGGTPVKEIASLAEIIRESANFTCRGSQVRAVFDLASDLKPAEVDPAQISQVVQNLVLNAVQAMPSGGTLRITAENVELTPGSGLPLQPGCYVKIGVHDEGVGIPKAYLSKIFDPYFSTKSRGSGLGLATAYSIVKNHEGYMTVASELGKGSVFFLYLPATVKEAPVRPSQAGEPVAGRGRILVMDDDETVRAVAGRILSHLGYEVGFALDGEEALHLYGRARAAGCGYDAVIMDLTIPGGMGGKEAIGKLLEQDPEARAIVSSGYADDPIMHRYQEYGFRGVIRKPYRVEAFSRELARVLGLA